ncbi:MAG: 16S rRNA (adenine(1518)-N(6)/adenine(1519)-N(6))-dimethyltransferase RsmA [Bacilli bacterium]
MNSYNYKFKKRYGQNFLTDNNIVEKIVEISNITSNSLVIEIGPGAGIMTKEIAKSAKQVLAYEIDKDLEEILDKELLSFNNIDIIYDDFLKRDIKADLKKYKYDKLFIIANLPYYITTPIIMKLIEEELDIDKITIMVQKEVGERFSAKSGTKEYGSITVFLNYYFNITKEFIVNRDNFFPKPHVDSIILSLSKKDQVKEVKNKELFFKLVRDSFTFKRKNIRNNLKDYDLNKVLTILNKYNYDLTVRAEALNLDVFIDIANNL